jgi:hypothetical protein
MLSSELAALLATRINFRIKGRSLLEDYFNTTCPHALAKNPSASSCYVSEILGVGTRRVPASAETMFWLLSTHVLDRVQRDHFFARERRPVVWADFLKGQRITPRDVNSTLALPLAPSVFAYLAAHSDDLASQSTGS